MEQSKVSCHLEGHPLSDFVESRLTSAFHPLLANVHVMAQMFGFLDNSHRKHSWSSLLLALAYLVPTHNRHWESELLHSSLLSATLPFEHMSVKYTHTLNSRDK